jgi:P-type Cu2+ transporter
MAQEALIGGPATGSPRPLAASAEHLCLVVENMTCGGCMAKVERTLRLTPGVSSARANLSARRVSVEYAPDMVTPRRLVETLASAGYRAADIGTATGDDGKRRERELLLRIGVAGFAAANIMLLSVSVWAGLAGGMGPAAAELFHWLSALIALPAIAYAGQPFFRSAASAIAGRRINMDVPISVAVCLATGMSLFQTIHGNTQVYFDAAVSLLFFLLVGRFLDQRVRVGASGAAQNLLALKSEFARVIQPDGSLADIASRLLAPGMRVLVAAGVRVPGDGVVSLGSSDIDESLVTGESAPSRASPGSKVYAGTVNLTGPLEIKIAAADSDTLLAQISRLMQAAEQGRGAYVRLADRAARLYAPLVHILALVTFAGWMLAGAAWDKSLTAAIAVLIITCPCALALAVPAVQIAATSRLLRRRLIVKSPDALERLAEVDTVVFDKTGTLTLGEPALVEPSALDPSLLRMAASLAAASRHPYARALVSSATKLFGPIPVAKGVVEHPGLGLTRAGEGGEQRLGSAAFLGIEGAPPEASLWYSAPGQAPCAFRFTDPLRPDARAVILALAKAGYRLELLSGDTVNRVTSFAADAGIALAKGGQQPADKLARLEALKSQGHKTLMIGDGLNDAPALASGHASLSPASAADISQTAADAVWLGASLAPVIELLSVARQSRRMAMQNFGIALAYNSICVPLAMLGLVTPLIAALAMSTSSIAVTANALRLTTKTCKLKAARP